MDQPRSSGKCGSLHAADIDSRAAFSYDRVARTFLRSDALMQGPMVVRCKILTGRSGKRVVRDIRLGVV